MPKNVESTPVATDLELEGQKQKLLADIDYLSGKLNEYESQSKQIINREAELLELKDYIEQSSKALNEIYQDIKDKQFELNTVVLQVSALYNKKIELNRELGSLEIERDQSKKTLSATDQALNAEIAKKKQVLGLLDNQLTIKNGELSVTSSQLTSLEFRLSHGMNDLANLEQKIEEAKQIYVEKQVVADLLRKEVDELNQQKTKVAAEVKDFLLMKEAVLKEVNVEKNRMAQEQNLWAAQENKERLHLESQRGDLSVREKRLEEKKEALRLTKLELENFYDRSIKHINL